MPINQDTHYVIKNGIVEQPAVVKDGLELYYDAKGKHNTDVHKDTLLDLSGNNRHGTLVNFAYEGVSGYQENGTGGILLDDVDDKIVRPAISGIEYTSASRNLLDIGEWLKNATVVTRGTVTMTSSSLTLTSTGADSYTSTYNSLGMYIKVEPSTSYTLSFKKINNIAGFVYVFFYTDNQDIVYNDAKSIGGTALAFTTSSDCNFIKIRFGITLGGLTETFYDIQLEKGSVATPYTPYIPLPIMTYQMNGNILSFEKDGTVKRTTKDANGNEVVVSRKGINLVRNGNFANGVRNWHSSKGQLSYSEGSLKNIISDNAPFSYVQAANLDRSVNDKYYVNAYARVLDSQCLKIELDRITPPLIVNSPLINEWYRFSSVGLISSVKPNFIIMYTYDSSEIAFGKAIELKEIQMINLTQAYGAGNEPTLEYIQSHPEEFAWTPNPNDLIETVEIKNNLVGDLENLQGNDFEQHEDGVITYTNEAEEGSVVRVDIDGISDQPLRFRNATGEQVVITEHDQTDADAIKKVEFQGNSVQLADKYREVSGTSVVIAPELHDKNVADKLVIGGNTTQYTESSNVVTDGLQMWLSGRNFSNSPATTVWKDLTGVNNGTASGFEYRTNVYADVVSDFTGKTAGSTASNANIMRYAPAGNCTSIKSPLDQSILETDNVSGYNKISVLDNVSAGSQRATAGEIPQHIFSFNIIKAFEKQHGNIPSTDQTTASKVAWLKSNISRIGAKWYGYGVCPSGYKAKMTILNVGNSWNAYTLQNTAGSPTLIDYPVPYVSNPQSYIQADGFVHYVAYTDASDGVTASAIYTDYVLFTMVLSGKSGSDGVDGVNFDGVDDIITTPEISIPKHQGWTYDSVMSFNNADWVDFAGISSSAGQGGSLIHHSIVGLGVYQDYYNSATYLFASNLMAGTAFPLNTPTRITISYKPIANENKGTFTFYINGVKRVTLANQTLSPNPSLSVFKFKYIGSASSRYFNGNIKTALLYNRTLTDAEILQNYNAGLAIPIPNIAMPQEVKHVNSGSKVLVHSKNLFGDRPHSTKYGTVVWSDNSFTVNGIWYVSYKYDLKPNTNYIISGTKTGTISSTVSVWGADGGYDNIKGVGGTTRDISLPFNTGNRNSVYIAFYSGNSSSGTSTFTNIQLEEGTTATAYEPFKGYQETTIPVTLKSIG